MSLTETVIEGTLNPDGTLELDEKPNLPPGRVRVVLQVPGQAPAKPDIADLIDKIRADLQASGVPTRTAEEIETALRESEDEYEEKMRNLHPQSGSGHS